VRQKVLGTPFALPLLGSPEDVYCLGLGFLITA
jgi:hypothetical protein